MATVINSDTQFTDESTGELINNGFIYIGLDGLDAKLNPAVIYSERDLNPATALANPQRTGADGRSVNKIWVDGKYSMKVENFENVQKLNRLSLGELTQTGNTVLTNVQGADSLTAEASPAITALVNNQVYILTAASNNTTAMTLTIGITPTWPIKKHHDLAMVANDVEANQTLALIFNDTDNVYELMTNSAIAPVDVATAQTITGDKTFTGNTSVAALAVTENLTLSKTLIEKKGADIVSANDTILLDDGNINDITGAITINGLTTPAAGNPVRRFHLDGAPLLKHDTAPSGGFSKLFIINSAVDYQASANDEFVGYYDGVYWRIFIIKSDGRAVVDSFSIEPVTATVAGNDLTVGLNPTSLTFRSATLTDGIPVERVITSAINMVVQDGATLGAIDGRLTRLYELAIDNAGTVESAITNASSGNDLREEGVTSTKAIATVATGTGVIAVTTGVLTITGSAGTWEVDQIIQGTGVPVGTYITSLGTGSGGDGTYNTNITTAVSSAAMTGAAGVGIYSTTARSNVAYRVVGIFEFTQATAGTYATPPSLKQGAGGNALTSMSSFGYGQKWLDLTASRSDGVTYYNTSGKPKQVSISSLIGVSMALYIIVDGILVARNSYNGTSGEAFITAIIPPGNSYSVTIISGTIDFWTEL